MLCEFVRFFITQPRQNGKDILAHKTVGEYKDDFFQTSGIQRHMDDKN